MVAWCSVCACPCSPCCCRAYGCHWRCPAMNLQGGHLRNKVTYKLHGHTWRCCGVDLGWKSVLKKGALYTIRGGSGPSSDSYGFCGRDRIPLMNSTVFKTFPSRRVCKGAGDGVVCGAWFSKGETDVFNTPLWSVFFCKISILSYVLDEYICIFWLCASSKLLLLWVISQKHQLENFGNRFSNF